MRDIIKTYSIREECFKNIGGTSLIFTNTEISLLFGIKCDSKPLLKLSYNLKPKTQFITMRHFNDHKMLTKPILENCFKNAFVGETTTDFEDVARILCLYVCATLFFPIREHSLRWGFVNYVEDLKKIKRLRLDWSYKADIYVLNQIFTT